MKAYLITTSFHEKSTAGFLTPVLTKWWLNARGVDPDRLQLAQKQFDFYAGELQENNPYSKDSDMGAVGKARHYLAQFGGMERVYTAMLAEAGKNPPINFNKQFPGSAAVVVESHEVPGAFSKAGYAVMKDALAASRPLLQGRAVGARRPGRHQHHARAIRPVARALFRRFRQGMARLHEGRFGGTLYRLEGRLG